MLPRVAAFLAVAVVAAAAAAAGPVTAGGCFDVRTFGAAGDGSTDDTVAFNDAAAAAGPTAGCVRVPPANMGAGYVLTSTVQLPMGVKLIGELAGLPSVPWRYGAPGDVSTTGGARVFARPLAATHDGTRGDPLFFVRSGCTVRWACLWCMCPPPHHHHTPAASIALYCPLTRPRSPVPACRTWGPGKEDG